MIYRDRKLMEIVNIVATGNLGEEINLNDLALSLPDQFRYEPEMYHCGYLEVYEKSISIFSSGKYIMVGLKGRDEVKELFSKMIDIFDNLDIDINPNKPPTISNMVVYEEINQTINLNKLAIYFGLENVTYEPETFPGLIYRNNRTFNIYSTGKILSFGKDFDDIKKDLKELKEELKNEL